MRGTLEQFIPADYYKTEEAFLGRVEEEADMFRPFGEKVYSYTRMAPGAAGKGKGVGALVEADADAVVFEVWHVSWCSAGLGLATVFDPLQCSGQMGHAWVQGIPSTDAAFYPALYRSRVIYPRRGGIVGVCRPVGTSLRSLYQTDVPLTRLWSVCRFEKRKRRTASPVETYHFVGYSSLYPFYCYPEKVRLRLR